jgi:hypothetical protein
MKKLTFCVLIWAFLSSSALAQRSELGVFAGGSFYLGDLNPSGLFSQTQPAFGAVYRFNLTTRWTLRANFLTGMVMADDAISGTPERNLHFRSRVNEFSIQAEINFLTYFTGSQNHRFSPFLFGGVGAFTFNPQARVPDMDNPLDRGGRWIDLAPLFTEGQGAMADGDTEFPSVYNTTQLVIPFGFGFKFSLNRTFSLGVEWGMRLTFTDYLDDVSGFYVDPSILVGTYAIMMADRSLNGPQIPGTQRGNSNNRDWYSFAGITLTARIGSGPGQACPAMQQRRVDQIRRNYLRMR